MSDGFSYVPHQLIGLRINSYLHLQSGVREEGSFLYELEGDAIVALFVVNENTIHFLELRKRNCIFLGPNELLLC